MAIALILGIKPNQDFALTKPSLATVADKGGGYANINGPCGMAIGSGRLGHHGKQTCLLSNTSADRAVRPPSRLGKQITDRSLSNTKHMNAASLLRIRL